jgi:dUTP pyrophosphatase
MFLSDDKARAPSKATVGSAGYDLFSVESATISPGERKLIKTGVRLAIPDGIYGRIAPRSGLAYKHGIDVMAGVIDSDYRGDIGVILYNSDKQNAFSVCEGDRIAQIIFEKCYSYSLHQVFESSELDAKNKQSYVSTRYDGGFGSTGC